jgi:hypothetical protein
MTVAAAINPPMILAGLFTVSPCFDFYRSSHRGCGIVNQTSGMSICTISRRPGERHNHQLSLQQKASTTVPKR